MAIPAGPPQMTPEELMAQPLPGVEPTDILGGFWGGNPEALDPAREESRIGMPYAPGQGPGNVYYAGEEFEILRGMTPEDRIRLQQQFLAVGLASKVVFGELDGGEDGRSGTLGAMRQLLGMANAAGEDWTAVLNRIATNPAMQEAAQAFDPKPYIQPDYATLSQRVKQTFREALGRDPDTYEMQQLAGELTGFYELEHEASTEFEQLQHEAAVTPGSQPAGTVQSVDPMARFQELFDQKYKHELDFVEDKAEAQVSRQVVEAGASTLSQMSRRP